MLQTVRLVLTAASLAIVALPVSAGLTEPALAQTEGNQGEASKQVALSQPLVDKLLSIQPELVAAQAKAQAGNSDQPNPQVQAAMEAIAKKHGFDSLGAYEEAADSVGIVLAGMDPETKTYVGPMALIKKQIAQVAADKTLPPKDKAETLKEMKEALATAGQIQPIPGNTDIVAKNYDKLREAFQSGE